ncbi:MAG TPA: hypothetical protein VER79_12695 [Candidatus Limnocylindrales bacterium]|nr:hypothetical protein [Candidatus Limnocylindrales bacterium]
MPDAARPPVPEAEAVGLSPACDLDTPDAARPPVPEAEAVGLSLRRLKPA